MDFKKLLNKSTVLGLCGMAVMIAGKVIDGANHKNEMDKLKSDTVAEVLKQVTETQSSDKKGS